MMVGNGCALFSPPAKAATLRREAREDGGKKSGGLMTRKLAQGDGRTEGRNWVQNGSDCF